MSFTHALALLYLSALMADSLAWGDSLSLGLAALMVGRIIVMECYGRRAYHSGKVDKCWLIG
jgi:hypothetical protein